MKFSNRSCLVLICLLTSVVIPAVHTAHAQYQSSPIQQKSSPDGIMMEFSYNPAVPIINNFTTFQFNVLNSTTNQPLQNYVATVIVGNVAGFTGGSSYFNFSNIQVPNGNFSVRYAFPNDGTFPVNLRVDTSNNIDVAQFQVVVPPQTNVLSNGDNTILYIGIAVAVGGVGAGIAVMLKRKTGTNTSS